MVHRVSLEASPNRAGDLGILPDVEQALMRALIGLDLVPLSVVHGVFSDNWLSADQRQPRYDVSFQQWTVSA